MPEAALPTVASSPPVAPRPKVLVVDDELGPRESITYLLQDEFDVVAVDLEHHRLIGVRGGKQKAAQKLTRNVSSHACRAAAQPIGMDDHRRAAAGVFTLRANAKLRKSIE